MNDSVKLAKKIFTGFINSMVKLSINKSKVFLPLSMSKGTTEQRLQKARLLNLRFYDNLQDKFVNREIKQSVFKRILKETSGFKPGIEIFESGSPKKAKMTPLLGAQNKIRGYAFALPVTYWFENIHKSSAQLFLKTTQRFFNEIFNPKFLARKIIMNNKGYNTKEAGEFYMNNIAEKQTLNPKNLDKYLQMKKAEEKINILQFFRYSLLDERNVHQAEHGIDKHIEKADHLKFQNKNYDLSEYHYDEKLALLNKKLGEIIQSERNGLKKEG